MSSYYFIEENKQFGPFNLEELLTKRIQNDTLVWKEDTTNWVKAEDIPELKGNIFSVKMDSLPPTLPYSPKQQNQQQPKKWRILRNLFLSLCILIGLYLLFIAFYQGAREVHPFSELPLLIIAIVLFIISFFLWKKNANLNKKNLVVTNEIRGRVSNFSVQQVPKGQGMSTTNFNFNIIRFDENDKPLPKISVQLEGYSIKGFITEGDEVGVPGNWSPPQTMQIKKLFNYSTNSFVEAKASTGGCGLAILIVVVIFFLFVIFSVLKSSHTFN